MVLYQMNCLVKFQSLVDKALHHSYIIMNEMEHCYHSCKSDTHTYTYSTAQRHHHKCSLHCTGLVIALALDLSLLQHLL